MRTIEIITLEDVKNAIREVLAEQKLTTDEVKNDDIICGLKSLSEYGIGVTTAWKLVKSGKLPHYRSGKKIFFKRSEIEEFFKKTHYENIS